MIKLGQKVKDKVSGFTGITIAKTEYLNGCIQFQVVPKMKPKETAYPGGVYIDIEQLDVVGAGRVLKCNKRDDIEDAPSGGVRMVPPGRNSRR